jgi:hypothetical protein
MAADLALAGWDINLFELPRFKENIIPLLSEDKVLTFSEISLKKT